jgi:hypothetical protein
LRERLMNYFQKRGVAHIGTECLPQHPAGGIFETGEHLRPHLPEQDNKYRELQAADEVLGRRKLTLATGFD